MKTKKEIQLAALAFSRAFKNNQTSDLNGIFIPLKPNHLYKEYQFYLIISIFFGLLFSYLSYHVWFTDAIYYWYVDGSLIIGIAIISLFLIFFLYLIKQYLQTSRYLKKALEQPEESPYGVLITKDYYFENSPDSFHIIPRDNIVHIDHEEVRNQEIYLELLLDIGGHYEVRGISYYEAEFDFKAWITKG